MRYSILNGVIYGMKLEWNKKYTTIAIYACIVFSIAAIILTVCLNFDAAWAKLQGIVAVFNPIFLGIIIAYLCNPLLRLFERRVFTFPRKDPQNRSKKKLCRTLSLICTYLVIFLFVFLFLQLLVPQIANSYNDLISRFSTYISSAITFVDGLIRDFPLFNGEFETVTDLIDVNELMQKVREFITNSGNLLTDVANYLLTYSVNVVAGAKNLLLALIISVYLLAAKERLLAQTKKICSALLPDKHIKSVFDFAVYSDRTFGGFIVGKLLDSLIIGILSFIVFAIFDMPYYPLIAVIVGVTNVIPFFGPFIGAIPSAFIIFIADPPKTIWFIILIFLIQQLDGNVIGPKILGESTGLSSLGVVVSITIMSGLFGIAGMFFGVPLFAILCALGKKFIDARLQSRELPLDTGEYYSDPSYIFEEDSSEQQRHQHLHTRIFHKIKTWIKNILAKYKMKFGKKK